MLIPLLFISVIINILFFLLIVELFISNKYYIKAIIYKLKTRRKQKMTGNHLVSEELLATVRLTDNEGVPKKGENPEPVEVAPGVSVSIEGIGEYTDPNYPDETGTEFTIVSSVEAKQVYPVKVKVDPKIGDPVGEIYIEYNGDADTEATKGNIVFGTRPKQQ